MLERLANVMYYFFGICSTLSFFGLMYLDLDHYKTYGYNGILEDTLIKLVIGLIIYAIGWSIRYILTGNKKI